MSDRIAEREHIARELHDTSLQGVQAPILRFHLIADDLPMRQAARRGIEQALDAADDMLAETRDRVSDVRATGLASDFEV